MAYIMNYCNKKYPLILKEFIKNNSFINSVYQEYNRAKREAEAEKRRQEEMKRINEEVDKYVKQAEKVIIPENVRNNFEGAKSFKIFSREQINNFKNYYDKAKAQR